MEELIPFLIDQSQFLYPDLKKNGGLSKKGACHANMILTFDISKAKQDAIN